MLTYGYVDIIADAVYDSLGIDEDIYLTFDKNSVKSFQEQYSKDSSYISDLVDAEIAKYDTSENNAADIADIRESAVEEVERLIDENIEKYYQYEHQKVLSAYSDIVKTLRDTAFENVVDVDVDYDPADPSVGIYNETRTITFTLANGATITMDVSIDEDDI